MKAYFVILALLMSGVLYSQDYDTPEQQNREALKSIEVINKILSATDTSSNAPFEKTQPGLIDSICNSYKTVGDYEDEKVGRLFMGNIEDLGNQLKYYQHYLGRMKVSYTTFKIFLFKISFRFLFTYAHVGGKTFFYTPSKEFIDSLIKLAKFPVRVFYTKHENEPYGFGFGSYYNASKNQFQNYYKDLTLEINFNNSDKDLVNEVNRINDPANLLEYGFSCSVSGTAPEGLDTFAKLVHFKKIYLIEQLIFSPNPVTRLMANDAIEYYVQNNFYTPPKKVSAKMKEIINEQIVINTCWGCYFEGLTMKEAYIKAAESKKHLYDNFIFIK